VRLMPLHGFYLLADAKPGEPAGGPIIEQWILWVVLLAGAGFLLILLELFVPSAGLIGLLAAVVLVAATVIAFQNGGPTAGLITLLAIAAGVPCVVFFGFGLWTKSPLGRRFMLEAPKPEDVDDADVKELHLRALIGQHGVAVTPLRPAGIVEVNGMRVDTVTEGIMVEAGTRVKVVSVQGHRVVVRPVEGRVP
jgi:membrane-bound serine protease (ClpP class)